MQLPATPTQPKRRRVFPACVFEAEASLRVGRAVVTRAVQEETARAEEKTKRLNKAATTIQRAWRTYHAAKGGGAKGGGKAEKAEKKGGKKKK